MARERDDERIHGTAPDQDDATSADVEDLLRRLHEHLAETAERPVETEASRWLGEAEVVAADVADGDAPRAAVETRVRQVGELLSHVGATGDATADEHLAAARVLVADLEGRL
jgi:hypothetical protein